MEDKQDPQPVPGPVTGPAPTQKTLKELEEEITRKNELMAKALGKIELLQSRVEQKDKELAAAREKYDSLTEKLNQSRFYPGKIQKIVACIKIQGISWILFSAAGDSKLV